MDAPSLTLALKQSKDVLNAHRSLHVADERPRGVVEEFDADLGDTTTGASPSEDLLLHKSSSESTVHLEPRRRGNKEIMDLGHFSELDNCSFGILA